MSAQASISAKDSKALRVFGVAATLLATIGATGCGSAGPAQQTFTVGSSTGTSLSKCSIVDNGNGSATIKCSNGMTFTLRNGTRCSVADLGGGMKSLSCDDGTSVIITDGAPGKDGRSCTVLGNGNGTTTISCTDGTQAVVRDGADGRSCSVIEHGNGTKTLACSDGTSVVVSDGQNGKDGTSCTVRDNSDGTKTVSCTDGTSATVTNGANGKDGNAGTNGLTSLTRLDDEAPGANCPTGGVAITTGLDLNADGTLQDGEVIQTKYVCNPACVDGTQRNGVKDSGESDVDCGGPCANACMPGLSCKRNQDCALGVCTNGLCPVPSCVDGLKNGVETDVDCGGATCPDCPLNKSCTVNADCASGYCFGGQCTAQPSCSDGIKNGLESDVDCGGASCPPCGVGQTCSRASDCLSYICMNGICPAPTCSDGARNGLETDGDCGGGTCGACGTGRRCHTGSDCLSNVCTNGTCEAPAAIVVTPASLSFAERIGVAASGELTLVNQGGSVTITGVTIAGSTDLTLGAGPSFPVLLPSGGQLKQTIVFVGSSAGVREGQVVFSTSSPSAPTVSVPVSYRAGDPAISTDVQSLAFGAVYVDEYRAPWIKGMAFHVTNVGYSRLTITSLAISGPHASDFWVGYYTFPLSLAPGQSQSFPVNFDPTAAGTRTATVSVVSDDPFKPVTQISCAGTGI